MLAAPIQQPPDLHSLIHGAGGDEGRRRGEGAGRHVPATEGPGTYSKAGHRGRQEQTGAAYKQDTSPLMLLQSVEQEPLVLKEHRHT